jgi:hypothetical protein
MPSKRIAISWPETDIQRLKECHAKTYPEHRLSFSAWLLSRVQLSLREE